MPIKCFETKLTLEHGEPAMPRRYIYCTRIPPGDVFGQFAKRAKSEDGWRNFELDASHAPNVTAPEALMGVLQEIVDSEPNGEGPDAVSIEPLVSS